MSVTIRLSKVGKKNAPTYKVVVSNTKDKRYGRFLEILGFYNPGQKESFAVNKDKLNDWRKKGALISDAVVKLLEGTYTYTKYDPKGQAAKAAESEKAAAAETAEKAAE